MTLSTAPKRFININIFSKKPEWEEEFLIKMAKNLQTYVCIVRDLDYSPERILCEVDLNGFPKDALFSKGVVEGYNFKVGSRFEWTITGESIKAEDINPLPEKEFLSKVDKEKFRERLREGNQK